MNKKINLSILFLFALLVGLFGSFNINKVEAQYTVQECDKAVVNGIVKPNGESIVYWVEWWKKGSSNAINTGTKMTSNSRNDVGFTQEMKSLSALTTYEYRVVSYMTRNGNTKYSNTLSFTTPSCPLPTVNLQSNKSVVAKNDYVTLSWTSTPSAGNSCTLNYENNNIPVNPNSTGYQVGPIMRDTTFTVVCLNGSGSGRGSVSVRINQPVVNPIVNIYAIDKNGNKVESISIPHGTSATIGWSSTGATSCSASGSWSGSKSTSGTFNTGNLTSTKTYNILCSNTNGTTAANDSITVNVQNQVIQPPTVTLSANPLTITKGTNNNYTVLTWNSERANSCSSDWGTYGISGSKTVYPTNTPTQTYSITCTGNGGTSTPAFVTVTVNNQPVKNPIITKFEAIPPSVQYNGTTSLSWSANNASYCTSNAWSGNKGTSGYHDIYNMKSNKNYTLTCYNVNGTKQDSRTILVTVHSEPVENPTVSIWANPSMVSHGGATTIFWNVRNATSCVASGTGWSGNQTASNGQHSKSVSNLTSGKTYKITCSKNSKSDFASVTVTVENQNNQTPSVNTNSATGINTNSATLNGYVDANGNNSVSTWFEWGTNSNYGNQTNQVNQGPTNGTNFNSYLSGLSHNTTYYFRAVAQANNGQIVYGSQMSFTTTNNGGGCTSNCNNNNPSVTTNSANIDTNSRIVTLNGYLDTDGEYFRVKWFEYGVGNNTGTKKNDISHNSYSSANFSDTLSLNDLSTNTVYSYKAVAENSNGQRIYGNPIQFTTPSNNTTTPTINPCANGTCVAITTFATNIGTSSARLNGLGLANTSLDNTGWFEWGVDESLGISTVHESIGSAQSNPFNYSLFSLGSNRTYYYRAVVMNQYGTSRGDIVSFRTNSVNTTTTTNNTPIVTNKDSTSRPSLVMLTVSRDGESIKRGDALEYVINYKNIFTKNLKNVILRVAVPKDFEFIEANRGMFSEDDRVIAANIGNLAPGEEDNLRMRVKISDNADLDKIIVVTANMAYTVVDTNAQEEVFAYSTNNVKDKGSNGSNFGALAFLSGDGFMPSTLLGWLVIALLITLLMLAVKKAYKGPSADPIPEPSPANPSDHY